MCDKETADYNIPTNEEIVNELTKDLEASAIKVEPLDQEVKAGSEETSEKSDEESYSSLKDDDYIDEIVLKDLEIESTEDQKRERHEEAIKYKEAGNSEFKTGAYQEAASQYTLALRTCPLGYSEDRAVLFSNRAAAKMKLKLYKSGVEDCDKAIELKSDYVKAYYRRAAMYEALEKMDEALNDYKKILEIDPANKDAYVASQRLEIEIKERNEKLKTEMLGKLKDLGNMVLRPFGLSTENFKLNQDPNSGGYNISFQQNTQNSDRSNVS